MAPKIDWTEELKQTIFEHFYSTGQNVTFTHSELTKTNAINFGLESLRTFIRKKWEPEQKALKQNDPDYVHPYQNLIDQYEAANNQVNMKGEEELDIADDQEMEDDQDQNSESEELKEQSVQNQILKSEPSLLDDQIQI